MTVGVLALQGDFAEHMQVLQSLDVPAKEVRTLADLASVDRLIIPGGESTVMRKLLKQSGMDAEIVKRCEGGMPIFGTCAGAIVLAKEIEGESGGLGLIDITIERNAYGTQLQSFDAVLSLNGKPLEVSFIRAPKISRVGKDVEVLCEHENSPVLVKQGRVLVAVFHTEVFAKADVHEMFLSL